MVDPELRFLNDGLKSFQESNKPKLVKPTLNTEALKETDKKFEISITNEKNTFDYIVEKKPKPKFVINYLKELVELLK
jgi:hypothetical protein